MKLQERVARHRAILDSDSSSDSDDYECFGVRLTLAQQKENVSMNSKPSDRAILGMK